MKNLILTVLLFFLLTMIALPASVNISVSASTDDCDKRDAAFSNSDGAIWAGMGGDGEICDNGMRFQNITIAQGSTIDSAFVGMVANQGFSAKANYKVVIHCEDTSSATTFSTSGDFTSRIPTTASTAWEGVGAWTGGVRYYTPYITTSVQEVINRGDWSSGNDLVVLMDDNGSVDWEDWRIWYPWDYDDHSNAPDITIYYTEGGAEEAPARRRRMILMGK